MKIVEDSEVVSAPGCSINVFLASFLRYLLRFLVSTMLPMRVITDDLPNCARVLMAWHNAAFFGVEVLFFNPHFLVI